VRSGEGQWERRRRGHVACEHAPTGGSFRIVHAVPGRCTTIQLERPVGDSEHAGRHHGDRPIPCAAGQNPGPTSVPVTPHAWAGTQVFTTPWTEIDGVARSAEGGSSFTGASS